MNDIDIKQYKSKNAYIVGGNIFYSYNTPIAVNLNGVTFVTENYYSNTTAHHKTDAKRYFDNNLNIIVNHNTLISLINEKLDPKEVLIEYKLKQELLKLINLDFNYNKAAFVLKKSVYDIKQTYEEHQEPRRKEFKNGNKNIRRFYRTDYKYLSNLYWETVEKFTPNRHKLGVWNYCGIPQSDEYILITRYTVLKEVI